MCPRCGVPFPAAAGADHLCGRCLHSEVVIGRARACTAYSAARGDRPGPLERAVGRFKYGREIRLGRLLGRLLAERCPFGAREFDVVVPVPLHPRRLRWRGFNQSQLLAGELARRWGIRVDPFAVERVRPTRPQVGLERAERLRNVRGAFAVARSERVEGKRVLLVDDVCTSGATLETCAGELSAAGAARVDALVLARALPGWEGQAG